MKQDVNQKSFKNVNRIGIAAFAGTFGTDLFIQICSVFQGIIIARLLGPLGRGEYAAIILWPSLFAAISIMGSNISIARLAAKGVDSGSLSRSALLMAIVTSSLGIALCYFALPFLMPESETHLVHMARLFALFIPLNHLALNLIAKDQGVGDFKLYNLSRLILNPIYLAILTAFWIAGVNNLEPLVLALLAANLVVVLFRVGVAFGRHRVFGKICSLWVVFKQSIHFALAGIANPFYQQADKVFLLWLLGAENLGIYVVALSASMAVGSLTSAAGTVTFTMAAQANHAEGFERVLKAFRISMLFWIFFGGLIAIIMSWILPLVYGPHFVSAITPARLLIAGSAFAGLSGQIEQAMRGQGRAFVGLEGRLVGLVIMVGAGVVLSKIFGLEGVCVAFVIGQFFCMAVIVHRTLKHYHLTWAMSDFLPGKSDIISVISMINKSSIGRLRF